MHGVAKVYHILCTNEFDQHIMASGACKPDDNGLIDVEKVRQHAPIADRLSADATFILDLLHRIATDNDGNMCSARMTTHMNEATRLRALLNDEIQAG